MKNVVFELFFSEKLNSFCNWYVDGGEEILINYKQHNKHIDWQFQLMHNLIVCSVAPTSSIYHL